MTIKSSILNMFVWKDLRKQCKKKIEKSSFEKPKKIYGSNLIFQFSEQDLSGYFRVIDDSMHSISSACKSKATEEVAKLLGMEHICPKSELVEIPGYGVGLLQEACDGISIMTRGRNARIRMTTPEFQRSINNLNLLDAVCHEMDHSPNNYSIVLDDNGMAKAVVAFDNNGIGTFSLRSDVDFSTYLKCSPYVTNKGVINRPFVSLETAEKLMQIRFAQLFFALRKIIGLLPIIFTYLRITKLRRAIRRTRKTNPGLLVKNDQWSEKTIQKELEGSWGKTYLNAFIYDC